MGALEDKPFKVAELQKRRQPVPLKFGDGTPIPLWVTVVSNTLFVEGVFSTGIEVEFRRSYPTKLHARLDWNHDDSAMEMVIPNGRPACQIVYPRADKVQIYGGFSSNGQMVGYGNRFTTNLTASVGKPFKVLTADMIDLKPLFKYPSGRYPGVREEQAERADVRMPRITPLVRMRDDVETNFITVVVGNNTTLIARRQVGLRFTNAFGPVFTWDGTDLLLDCHAWLFNPFSDLRISSNEFQIWLETHEIRRTASDVKVLDVHQRVMFQFIEEATNRYRLYGMFPKNGGVWIADVDGHRFIPGMTNDAARQNAGLTNGIKGKRID